MTETTVFTKSIARKKAVPERYQPNTYRVISSQAEDFRRHRPSSSRLPLPTNNIGQRLDRTQVNKDYRRNRPNPINVGFLCENARTYNEPISAVVTAAGKLQRHWWPTVGPDVVPRTPPLHTLDTEARQSYQYHGGDCGLLGHGRHFYNPEKLPRLGIVPVNLLRRSDGKQRFWNEGLSMEQHMNCRRRETYPMRGKRQGAFVWTEIPPMKVDGMLHKMDYIADKSHQVDEESIRATVKGAVTKPKAPVSCDGLLDPAAAYEAMIRRQNGMPVIV